MDRFQHHRGVVAPLDQRNIDTDQIIPARFLHRPRNEGYGELLFYDLRTRSDGSETSSFVLDSPAYKGASILVAQENFGCGSAREHAVWALSDFGIKVVIAPSFGDIFYNNALHNRLLVVRLDQETVHELIGEAERRPGLELAVDLANQVVEGHGLKASFDIDPYSKEMLMLGLSETELTLRRRNEIEEFERQHMRAFPWLQSPFEASKAPSHTAKED